MLSLWLEEVQQWGNDGASKLLFDLRQQTAKQVYSSAALLGKITYSRVWFG